MDMGHKLGLLFFYCVMAGYAALLLGIFAQIFFRAAIEKRRRRKRIEQNAQPANKFRALVGKRGWHNSWLPKRAEVNVSTPNGKVNAGPAGARLFVKQVVAVVSVFIALGVASIVAAQQRSARDVSASDLKQQLIDVEIEDTQLRIRLEELNEQLKPESIERELAGIGSVHPEELREHRRKLLTLERSGLQAQLALLEKHRAQIEAAIAAAETAAYPEYAQPAPTPPPMTEMAIMNLPIKRSLVAMAILPLVAAGMILLLIAGIKRIRPQHELLLTMLFALLILPAQAQSQKTESMTAFAKGHGSIVSVVEEQELYTALVVLRQNGQAVITLYSDMQLQVQGTWSVSDSSPQEVLLKITGLELGGNASGSGKLVLTSDRKYIRELTMTGKLLGGAEVTARFTAHRSDDSQHDTHPILVSPAAVAAKTAVRVRSETVPLAIY